MGNYYSYMRISTDTERQNFARQEKALKKYAEEAGTAVYPFDRACAGAPVYGEREKAVFHPRC